MKTKEQYLDAVSTLGSKGKLAALVIILTTVMALLVMHSCGWISRHAGMGVAIGCYFAVQFIVPMVALLLAWKLKSFTKKADLICPACGKPLINQRRNIKKVVADNKCPSCGGALYPA